MAKEKEKEKEAQDKQPGSKNKIFLIALPLLAVLVLGGAAGAYFLGVFSGGTGGEEAAAASQEEQSSKKLGPLIQMEDFVVNIMHDDTTRFLKVGITLEAENKESKKAVERRIPQIKDAVLLHIGNKRFDDIKDLQGKMQLKADLLATIQELAGKGRITNLFFTDFVVQ